MKVKYEHDQLVMIPENPAEDGFCKDLIRRMVDSNYLMGWYGDVRFDKETSGYKIAYKPDVMKAKQGGTSD